MTRPGSGGCVKLPAPVKISVRECRIPCLECELAPAQLVDIRNKLLKIIDNESDSLRIYHMGSNWHHKIEQLGKEKSFDISGPLII